MKKPFPYDWFVSSVFILIVLLPLLFSFANRNVSVSATEKRRLAEFPAISLATLHAFPKKFEAYYEDHFGFRDAIVRVHNYALCKVFGISPHDMVVAGTDDWYFFNAEGAISDYLGRVEYNKKQLERIKYTLHNRSEWLQSLNIRYLYLPIPNKEAVYDEYMPLILRKNKGYDSYSQVVDYLNKNSNFSDFVDTKKVLLDSKKEGLLYLRTDSHWNYDGAYFVYRSIISRMQQWFSDIRPLQQKNEKKWDNKFSGDLSILMNLNGLVTEKAPTINVLDECNPGTLQPWGQITQLPEYAYLPAHRIPVANGCKEKNLKAIVIHDSFGLFLRPYLSQHFASVIYITSMNFEGAKALIERERPNIVLDLRVARNIDRSVLPDPELEQRLLAGKFAASGPAVVSIDKYNWLDYLYKSRKTIIQETTGGLNLSFSEQTSSVHLVINSANQLETPLVVRIEGTNNQLRTMSFCSHLRGDKGELLRQVCEERNLGEGSNQIFFRIYDPQAQEILELAPSTAGSFTLHALQVKQEVSPEQDSEKTTGSASLQDNLRRL